MNNAVVSDDINNSSLMVLKVLKVLSDLAAENSLSDIESCKRAFVQSGLAGIRLVIHREDVDGSRAISAQIPLPSGHVASLSLAARMEIPWPLRGVQRWSDQDVLRVNGRVLSVQQVMAHLDFLWSERSVVERLVSACLIQDEIESRHIDVGPEQLQNAVDLWRRRYGLQRRDAMESWLAARGISLARFSQYIADELKVGLLKKLYPPRVVKYLIRTRLLVPTAL